MKILIDVSMVALNFPNSLQIALRYRFPGRCSDSFHSAVAQKLQGRGLKTYFQAWFHCSMRSLLRKQMNHVMRHTKKRRQWDILNKAQEATAAHDMRSFFQIIEWHQRNRFFSDLTRVIFLQLKKLRICCKGGIRHFYSDGDDHSIKSSVDAVTAVCRN